MKARMTAPKRIIAAYGLGEQKLSALSLFCDRENICLRPVTESEADMTVGEILSTPGGALSAHAGETECLIFSGFERQSLTGTVGGLRAAGLSIPLKAAATPSNVSWTLKALLAELRREHEYMTSRGGAK